MPEGDTVRRTADRLNEALAGAPLVEADLRWPSLAAARLVGDTTTEVVARGKHILHRLDSGLTLHSHLRMEGQWSVAATDALSTRTRGLDDVRAILGTERWTAVGRRLGMLDLVATADESTLVGHLGPDILGADWSLTTAVANVSAASTTLGAALLDQRNLAGIGTLWASEALFVERVHPWSPTDEVAGGPTDGDARGPTAGEAREVTRVERSSLSPVSHEDVQRVVARAHRLMRAALPYAMQAPTGIRREGQSTYVHSRSGRPCRRCGDTIRIALIGPPLRERTMFYCPTCQGGLAPTDDGRLMRPLGSSPGSRPGYRKQ